jgi:hypothetical protein
MDTKTILIVVGLVVALWLGGCFPSAQASTGQAQPPLDSQACYNHANGIVSPAWAGMNKIQRAVLAMQVINTCEGK